MSNPTTSPNDLWGHPKGLYICFATELWERFSFYGMKYLLLLYLTKYHLFSDAAGLGVLGSYASLVYAMPVLGGLIADRFIGMRKAVTFGGLLLVAGHLGMAYEGEAARQTAAGIVRDEAALSVFYLSLALIIVGVGFLKPNISTVVGKLYPDDDPRRDSGFTIFYMGINVGAFAATLLCGWLGEVYGWSWGFGAAGIGGQRNLATDPPDYRIEGVGTQDDAGQHLATGDFDADGTVDLALVLPSADGPAEARVLAQLRSELGLVPGHRVVLRGEEALAAADRLERWPGGVSGDAHRQFVRLPALVPELQIDGLVHVTSLQNDYYKFESGRQQLIGERTGRTYSLGDAMQVQVQRVDMDTRRIDFRPMADVAEPLRRGRRR